MIIGTLFILLGALVPIDGLREYAWQIVLLVVVLIVVVRPLTALVALLRTDLGWRDRALIGSIDPRGIVAASTAATFSGSLAAAGVESGFLLPVTFGVILGTGIVYGLGAKPVAGLLRVRKPTAKGVALVGHAPWVLDLGQALGDLGVPVLVLSATTRGADKARAQDHGVEVVSLNDHAARIARAGHAADVGQVVTCAPAGLGVDLLDGRLIQRLGHRHVFRVPDSAATSGVGHRVVRDASAHAFVPGLTLADIDDRLSAGATVAILPGPAGPGDIPLVAVAPDGTANLQPGARTPGAGDRLIALVADPRTTATATSRTSARDARAAPPAEAGSVTPRAPSCVRVHRCGSRGSGRLRRSDHPCQVMARHRLVSMRGFPDATSGRPGKAVDSTECADGASDR